jgi:hypothetical protein
VNEHVLCKADEQAKIKAALVEHHGSAVATIQETLKNRAVKLGDATYPIATIGAELHFMEGEGQLHVRTYEQSDRAGRKQLLQLATAEVVGKKFHVLFPDGYRSKQVTLEVQDAVPRKRQSQRAR